MTDSMDSQPAYFPSHSCHCSMTGHIRQPWGQRWGGYTWLNNMNCHSPSLNRLQLLLSARFANSRHQHWGPDMSPFPRTTSQQSGGSWLRWTTSSRKRTMLCPYWSTHSGYGFAFTSPTDSTKTTVCGLTECLIHCLNTPHSVASDQGTHLTAWEDWQLLKIMESTGLTKFSTILMQLAW